MEVRIRGFPKIRRTVLGDKDFCTVGSILGFPYPGKLPNIPMYN